VWYKLFMDVVNRHAPIRHKRVKHSNLPPWLNENIIQALSDRDRLKKGRMFTEYKTACNKVKHLVCSYLKNRVQRVFIHGSYSSEGTVKYGVPQGSVSGPVLFCIYINDLRLHIPSNSAECHPLADDTTLQTTGKSVAQIQKTLQLCLDRISVWCNCNTTTHPTYKTTTVTQIKASPNDSLDFLRT